MSSESAIKNRAPPSIPGTMDTLFRTHTDAPSLHLNTLLDLKLLAFSIDRFADQSPVYGPILLLRKIHKGDSLEFVLRVPTIA